MNPILQHREGLPKHFCPVPFTTIILEPNGDVGVCREHGRLFTIGNIREKSIWEIWNGDKIRNWRKEFLSDDIKTCSKLIRDKGCHLNKIPNELLPYAELMEIQTRPILKLTANFNGRCNLECQMCDIWKLPNGYYQDDNFWKPARKEIFPHLKEIDMLSGEPFIQKDTYRLFDEVLAVNPLCRWNITTNLHWKMTSKIRDYLDRINLVNCRVSIDSLVPEVYSKIRKKGDLSFVLSNLKRLLEFRQQRGVDKAFNISMGVTLQRDNWQESGNLVNFCNEKKIFPEISILYGPEQFSLLTLPAVERERVLDFLTGLPKSNLPYLFRVINPLIYSLEGKIDQAYFLSKLFEAF